MWVVVYTIIALCFYVIHLVKASQVYARTQRGLGADGRANYALAVAAPGHVECTRSVLRGHAAAVVQRVSVLSASVSFLVHSLQCHLYDEEFPAAANYHEAMYTIVSSFERVIAANL